MPVKDIHPAAYNPRKDLKPDDPEWRKIKRSMDEFGLVEPLVWNVRTGNLVGGHQRFKILTAEGATELQVSVVDLDEAREKALNLALNRVSGQWSDEQLAILLESLDDELIHISGFDTKEVAGLLEKLHATETLDDYVKRVQFEAGKDRKKGGDSGTDSDEEKPVSVSYAVTIAQRKTVLDAIKLARLETGHQQSSDALVAICQEYIETHSTKKAAANGRKS